MTRQTAVIVDVDGTLCDVSTALHHITTPDVLKDFDAFHRAAAQCPPTDWVLEWCEQQRAAGHVLVVVTGRMYRHIMDTTEWLVRHLPGPFIGPLMRGDDDVRPDTEVKHEIYTLLTDPDYYNLDIVAAIDDRPSVIRLWRSLGIPTTVAWRKDWLAAGEHYDDEDTP
ncbi:polynucleotide kinase [Gordonia phage SmokingBunny]|uniref:Polynucleotide kinase n=2 Tax=Wizardvirus TaxID=2169658 RepID=A0A6M3SZR4_9CAUD|nr:polynucleotide kinase [Gordonia phage SmokingBunny]YP_010107646.1 polynucleotide kinase [Gordonia phage Evamon]UVK62335.1 polynucleotide kinase [Gordonia phage Salvador]WAA20228.1 polynucleotide kinase [Gordonia phage Togo]QCG77821.1 polynucleotide kinase [Gordonia phage SmokingBunny]QJD51505.1 polynucleotide kinase [Gordonia phage Evamon]